MNAHDNPLLDFSGLPRFDAIAPAHVTPAVDALLADARRTIEEVATSAATPPGIRSSSPSRNRSIASIAPGAWCGTSTRSSTPRACARPTTTNLPKVIDFHTDLAQDLRLYSKYRALREHPDFAALDPARRRLVDNELRDFKLGGAELDDAGKARFKAMQEELADLSTQFEEHVLDATNAFAHYVEDEHELAGVPAEVVAEARAAAQAAGPAGLQADAAHALLPAGAAVCGKPRPAPSHARSVLDACVRTRRRSGLGQSAGDRSHPRASPRGRALAGLSGLCARLAGAEDGQASRRGHRVPARSRAACKALRRARLRRARDLRAHGARPCRARSLGHRVRVREAEGEPLRLQRTGGASVFSRGSRCWPGCSASSRPFTACTSAKARHRSGIRPCASSPSSDRNNALVGEFYFDLYAREGKQGGAWMDDAINRARVATARSSIQSPT